MPAIVHFADTNFQKFIRNIFSKEMIQCTAIIPAAGSGKRVGGNTAKQFITVNGKPLLAYTLEVFQKSKLVTAIQVVASAEGIDTVQKIIKKYKITKALPVVQGGKERQDSVYNGLTAINGDDYSLVAVHDAARPLLPLSVLDSAITQASQSGSALVAIPAKDTLLQTGPSGHEYLDRSKIYTVQTPQIFRYRDMINAYTLAKQDNFYGTDESMVMARYRYPVFLSDGSSLNFKVTTAEDLALFKKLTASKK